MRWLSYFFPRTIAKLSSLYNREIRINEEKGKLKLLVNGSSQSGSYIEMLWKEALKALGIDQSLFVKSILVLGVGGGTVINLLHKLYPTASITAVDIDPTIIDISKKYFGLDRLVGLSLVCTDANKYVSDVKKGHKIYNLIVVDLFIGIHIPDFVLEEQFLFNLKNLLHPSGQLIINYLREFAYGKKSDLLIKRLKKIFSTVGDKPLYNNRFLSARMVKLKDV